MIERAEPYRFGDGASIGVGSLPHRDSDAAAAFAIGEFDIATIPSLPQLSPLEGDDRAGGRAARRRRFHRRCDRSSTSRTKVSLDGAPVKWQFVGPVTLGIEY